MSQLPYTLVRVRQRINSEGLTPFASRLALGAVGHILGLCVEAPPALFALQMRFWLKKKKKGTFQYGQSACAPPFVITAHVVFLMQRTIIMRGYLSVRTHQGMRKEGISNASSFSIKSTSLFRVHAELYGRTDARRSHSQKYARNTRPCGYRISMRALFRRPSSNAACARAHARACVPVRRVCVSGGGGVSSHGGERASAGRRLTSWRP